MKKHLYLTGALVLLLVLVGSATLVAADQPATRSAAQAAATLEGPRWVLVSYATRDGKTLQAIPGAEATAQFEKGNVHGTTGCNNYEAPYEAKGDKLTVGVTATTMKMCPPPIMDQESAYLAAIQSAATYKIADGTLTIANAKGKAVLTYRAETPVSLTGGTWVMTGYNNGKQAVVSALPDVEVTAIFGADGQLSGSAGCNRYNAPYTVDGNKIKIGMAISTMMACEQPIMDQEAQYLAAIQTAATYKIEGSKLELRDATGSLLASYILQPGGASALVGPTWVMTMYNNGKQAVVGALADTEVTASFWRRRPAQRLGRLQSLQRALHGGRQQDQDRPGNLHHDGVRAADHGPGGAVPGRHPAGRHLQHPGHETRAAQTPAVRSWPAIASSPPAPPRWSAPPG